MANPHARALRKRMTVDESRLWRELKDLRRLGAHFRRQAPIGPYIVDFACFSKRIAIEVDGVQHATPEGRRADIVRDAWLTVQGFRVLRFTNGEVTESLEGVLLEIMAECGLIERPPPLSPPHKGEGNADR